MKDSIKAMKALSDPSRDFLTLTFSMCSLYGQPVRRKLEPFHFE